MTSPRSGSRRKRLLLRTLLGLGLVVVAMAGWAAATALLTDYPLHPRPVQDDPDLWHGAYHIHTIASKDGHGTVDDVVQVAREAGLDWALITDHNVVEIPPPEYRRGVLIVYAVESSTTQGHLVLLGSRRGLRRPERRGRTPFAIADTLGGALVAAHPFNRRRPFRRLDDPAIVGMEVLSLNDAFQDTLRRPVRLLYVIWTYPFNQVHAVFNLVSDPARGLKRWDGLLTERHVSGFGALDAHGQPPYEGPMRTLSMYARVGHAPTGDAGRDAEALTAAPVAGRAFLSVDAFSPGAGFRFTARTEADGVTHRVGDTVSLERRPRLRIELGRDPPPGIEVCIVCAGKTVVLPAVGAQRAYRYRPTAAGACRAEVWFRHHGRRRPWILSNVIRIR